MTERDTVKEQGNVLFIILIAVALFAALSFSVLSMSRDSTNFSSRHELLIAGNTIIDYANNIHDTAHTLLLNGVASEDISFDDPILTGIYDHTPDVDADKIFHNDGGGLRYVSPNSEWLDSSQSSQTRYGEWYFPANVCVSSVGTGAGACNSDGNDNEDLVAILPYISSELCFYINEKINVPLCSSDICDDVGDLWPSADTPFTGSFTDDAAIASSGSEYTGRTEGCIEGSGTTDQPAGTFFYYKVVTGR